MSERILQVVEEVKQAATKVKSLREANTKLVTEQLKAFEEYEKANENLVQAERKLRGIIYEETQINE